MVDNIVTEAREFYYSDNHEVFEIPESRVDELVLELITRIPTDKMSFKEARKSILNGEIRLYGMEVKVNGT